MKKYLFFVVFAWLILPVLNSQQLLKIKKSEFKITKEGFKEAWKAIKTGDYYVKEGLGTFQEARKNYLQAYRYNPNNAELNYMIGVCYLETDDKFESIKYLKKAYQEKPDVAYDIRYVLGRAYHMTLDFDNAILEYKECKATLSERELKYMSPLLDKLIIDCQNGKEIVKDRKRVVVLNLGGVVNSAYDDYNSVLAADESIMYFTSRRPVNEKSPRSIFDNKFYEDIYSSEISGTKWSEAKWFDKKVNKGKNKINDAAVALSSDKNKVYAYVGKMNSGDIYATELKKGKWTSLKKLKGQINTKYRESSLCFTADAKTIYFISSNPKTSLGGSDIYKIIMDINGKWKNPVNLGKVINTKYDETGVKLSLNDSTLYFSSKGHNTMGGFDIYKSVLNETGLWSQPENIGYPINTPDDDVFYTEAPGGKNAYYSTIRESGLGGKDIFKVIFLGVEKEVIQSTEDILIAGYPVEESIFFISPEKMQVDTFLLMKGLITDSESGKGIMARLEIIDPDVSQVAGTSISDTTGNYRVKIPTAKMYGIQIVARGYLLYLDNIDLTGETYRNEVIRNFKLEGVEVGAKVILKNIFFEFGKANLKPESFVLLDNVVALLESNTGMRIEISGHTDNIGSLKTNTKLSQARAEAVVAYLIQKGIDASRLESKGYAYNQPVAPNTTPDGRALNRRVEFKILSK